MKKDTFSLFLERVEGREGEGWGKEMMESERNVNVRETYHLVAPQPGPGLEPATQVVPLFGKRTWDPQVCRLML